jgi:hypothetical protein
LWMWSTHADVAIPYCRHKGVFALVKKSLYLSYINLAGPFHGNAGSPAKYNVTSKT